MADNLISPAMLQTFERSFYVAAQQKQTLLSGSGVVRFLAPEGHTHNFSTLKRFELAEVTGRNPNKVYDAYETENRQMTKKRYSKSFHIDEKEDINELIADPTSDLVQNLVYAKNRLIDRVIANAAAGSVLVGNPNEAATERSAADDGVITVDATSGLNYETIQQVTQNFINNDLPIEEIRGSMLALSGLENTSLMNEEKFINNDYLNGHSVNAGIVNPTGLYKTALFAGSVTGGIQVANPILPESTGDKSRTCLVLAPESILVAMKLNSLRVEPSHDKVGSNEVTIDFWINAMRTDGKRVQIIKTTY